MLTTVSPHTCHPLTAWACGCFALQGGVDNIHIGPGSHLLYLGAASGTTVSHCADLVGPTGLVYAVEFSQVSRPFPLLPLERYAQPPAERTRGVWEECEDEQMLNIKLNRAE